MFVKKCCSNILKTKALVSIFVKVRSFSFIALTSLFGHETLRDIVFNI